MTADPATTTDSTPHFTPRLPGAARVVIALGVVAVIGYGLWCVTTGFTAPGVSFRLIAGTDSSLYLDESRASIFSGELYTGAGPFLYLWLLKLCAHSFRAVVMVQSLLGAIAWATLAWSLARSLTHRGVQIAAASIVMLLAVAPPIIMWNDAIATESIAISITALVTALVLAVVRSPSTRALGALLAGLVLLVFTRDTLAILVLLCVPVLLVLAIAVPAARRRALAVAAIGIVAGGTALALSDAAEPPRWYYPTFETIALRIATQPDGPEFLGEHGYPDSKAVRELADIDHFFVVGVGRRWETMPEYQELRSWLRSDGRATMTAYLASHPGWVVSSAWRDRALMLDPSVEGYTLASHSWLSGATAVGHLAYAPQPDLVWVGLVLAVAATALVVARRRRSTPGLVVVGLAGAMLGVIHVVGAYHGDALEIGRHSIVGAVQIRLGIWIVLLGAIDALWPVPLDPPRPSEGQ